MLCNHSKLLGICGRKLGSKVAAGSINRLQNPIAGSFNNGEQGRRVVNVGQL
jgi:hypothetical protein